MGCGPSQQVAPFNPAVIKSLDQVNITQLQLADKLSFTVTQQVDDEPVLTVCGKDGKAVTGSIMVNKMNVLKEARMAQLQLGDKFRLSGVGDGHGDDQYLRIMDASGKSLHGGLAARELWIKSNARVGSLQVSEKWLLSGDVSDGQGGHPTDSFIRVLNADGTDFYGGIAVSQMWANNYMENADIQSCTNVTALDSEDILEKLLLLKSISFVRKHNTGVSSRRTLSPSNTEIGLYPDEVQQQLPALVSLGPKNQTGINYGRLSVALLEGLKQQQKQIQQLQQRVEQLEHVHNTDVMKT
eukprot:GILJ01012676.1.p1 GENE.GILJ01012676.1~~GILJ01012676.1.p1  ORF type:complete len:298 (-),score=44.55 GILJ01012676.1:27-920(-)